MTKHELTDNSGIAGSRTAPVGSKERSKDVVENFKFLGDAVKDTLGNPDWADQNVAFAVFAGHTDDGKSCHEAGKGKKADAHCSGIVFESGTPHAKLHLVIHLIQSLIDEEAKEPPKELLGVLQMLMPSKKDELEELLQGKFEQMAKIRMVAAIAEALGVPFKVGVQDEKDGSISITDLLK